MLRPQILGAPALAHRLNSNIDASFFTSFHNAGHFKIWGWQPAMDASLAPHAVHIEALCPLPQPGSAPLPQLALCRRLRHLTLRHVHASALSALVGLTALQKLEAVGEYDGGVAGWSAAACMDLQDSAGNVRLPQHHAAERAPCSVSTHYMRQLLPLPALAECSLVSICLPRLAGLGCQHGLAA